METKKIEEKIEVMKTLLGIYGDTPYQLIG